MEFKDFNLKDEILFAIHDIGYLNPTSIQEISIPHIIEGKDVIVRSNTGTGKTATFLLPILNKINTKERNLKSLVICPTRELAKQVFDNLKKYGKNIKGLNAVCIYGGQNIDIQTRLLKNKNHIVIGTPGRILEHIKKKSINLKSVDTVVLDEADEILSAGFFEDISKILSNTASNRQTLFFSATITDKVKELSNKFMNRPLLLQDNTPCITVDKTKKYAVTLKEAFKNNATVRFLKLYNDKKALIFCNTKKKVEELYNFLIKDSNLGRNISRLHSDILQEERNNVIKAYKKSNNDILVATDVAARGIDISGLDLVINYDIPLELEQYIHRIGRTGRNGNEGVSITYVVGKESTKIKEIEEYMKDKFCYITIPTKKEIENNNGPIIKKENEDNKESLSVVRLRFNVGKKDSIKVKDILGAITSNTVVPKEKIGTITLMEDYTLVDIDNNYVDEIIKYMKNKRIKGKSFSIEEGVEK